MPRRNAFGRILLRYKLGRTVKSVVPVPVSVCYMVGIFCGNTFIVTVKASRELLALNNVNSTGTDAEHVQVYGTVDLAYPLHSSC